MKKNLVTMYITMCFVVCIFPALKDINSEMLVAPCGTYFEEVEELE